MARLDLEEVLSRNFAVTFTREHLETCERLIRDGEARVGRQRSLLERLRRNHPHLVSEAEALLVTLEKCVEQHYSNYDLIIAQLSEPSKETVQAIRELLPLP